MACIMYAMRHVLTIQYNPYMETCTGTCVNVNAALDRMSQGHLAGDCCNIFTAGRSVRNIVNKYSAHTLQLNKTVLLLHDTDTCV